MGAMTLRNLDPKVLEALRRRAETEGRSVNALICEILARATDDEERRRRIREQTPRRKALRREILRRSGPGTPSEKIIRRNRGR